VTGGEGIEEPASWQVGGQSCGKIVWQLDGASARVELDRDLDGLPGGDSCGGTVFRAAG
jgi:hypothetical protein